jgi:DNA (cytosine-5)-methyltransferase 1
MKHPQFNLDLSQKIIVDLFAGGGGMSSAIEEALGRSPDIAINHCESALSLHRLNHPQTRHFIADVWEVCPRGATQGRPVGLLHLSPDCRDHSQAKGGQPRDKKIRALSWVGYRWAGQAAPDVITLENVKQILNWSPLVAKRDKSTGRVIKLDGSVAMPGERVPVQEQYLVPDPKRAGQTWRQFVNALKRIGYVVDWKMLNAADFGAPTTRERLFMVARRDGLPIEWPEPSHAKTPTKGQKVWRAAAECIDWSIPCPSIFTREKPLAEKTMRRIAKGTRRYVLEAASPFIVPVTHGGGDRVHDIRDPLRTITAAHRGELALATAYMMQANDGFNTTPGHDLRRPLTSITTRGSQQQLVTAHLAHLRGNCDARDIANPLMTVSAGGEHHALVETLLSEGYNLPPEAEEGALRVAAFLMRYYGEGGQWSDVRAPMTTVTTKDRMALVTVVIQGNPYVIVDIGLRMLTPRELFKAQGFYDEYIIDRGHDGRVFSKSTQVRLVGNSVSPPPAIALLHANAGHLAVRPMAKAG